MTTLVTADLHLAENPRDAYRFSFFDQLPALAAEHKADRVLILGDITEAKDGHHAALVNRVVDGFAALAKVAQVYVLMGNHDYVAIDVPFYRFLRHLQGVRWISNPTSLQLRGLGDCMFIPHTSTPQDIPRLVDGGYNWIFMHQTVDGASGGNRKLSGWKHCFDPRARVISGDVHVPQKIGPVTYVGSPYTVDFGDDFEPRVLLLDGTKMRSIPVAGPQKVLITTKDATKLTWAGPRALTSPGDIVKVRIELPTGSEMSRAEARARARDWAATAGVQLYSVQVVEPEAAQASKIVARDRPRAGDPELVRAYVKKMGKGETTAAAGLKIVEEVV